jgi:hypothetical protein
MSATITTEITYADIIKMKYQNIWFVRHFLSPLITYNMISVPPNGLRFTCAAKRSGAASGASACWAALV